MKANRSLWVMLLIVFLVSFNAACKRGESVQAAREDSVNTGLSAQDRDTAMKIEQSHLGEIDLARLAKQQASSRDVKAYADMIEDDHTKALKDVQKIMTNNGVNESTHSKPAEAQQKLSEMQTLSGAAFDRAFMKM